MLLGVSGTKELLADTRPEAGTSVPWAPAVGTAPLTIVQIGQQHLLSRDEGSRVQSHSQREAQLDHDPVLAPKPGTLLPE